MNVQESNRTRTLVIAWLSCQVVFIASALTLRLNKTYCEGLPKKPGAESDTSA